MNSSPAQDQPPRFSLARAAEALLGLVRCRLELLALEWQEEKERLLRLAIQVVLLIMLGSTGLALLLGLLAWCLYQWWGPWGLLMLGLLCLGTAAWGICRLLRTFRTGPGPFSTTLAEFKKDAQWLSGTGTTHGRS